MKRTINKLRITGVLPLAALVFDPSAPQAYAHGSFVLPYPVDWQGKIVAPAIANG